MRQAFISARQASVAAGFWGPGSNTSAGPAGSVRFMTPVGGTSACRGRHSSEKAVAEIMMNARSAA